MLVFNCLRGRLLLASVSALFCAVPAASALAQAPSRQFTDVGNQLRTDAEVEAWYGGMHKLRHDFDQICGDTFCEGDYSNIYGLRFRCSVNPANGVIGQCVWVFAASNEEVDAATGRIVVKPKTWRCRVPLAPKTSLSALLTTMSAKQPLYAPLPNSTKSIYDGLVDCL